MKIDIPSIRKKIPSLMAQDIIGVQPIDFGPGELTVTRQIDVHICDDGCENGRWVHDFIFGYKQIFDCPLERSRPNVTLVELHSGSSIFSMKTLPIDGIHLNCEIPNMSVYK